MANPIIQNYLHDNAVDYTKRQGVMDSLKAGQSEDSIAGLISKKYGDKYSTGVVSAPSPAEQKVGDAISTGLKALNPANLAETATGLVKKTAETARDLGVKADVTPAPEAPKEDYGILQPLRDATKGIRDDLDSKTAEQGLEENPALRIPAAIATSPAGKEFTRATGSLAMGAGEGLVQGAGNAADQLLKASPAGPVISQTQQQMDLFKKHLDELKTKHPESSADIDNIQNIINTNPANAAAQGVSSIADQGIKESTGIDKNSVSGNIGGAIGKAASYIPGMAAAGAAKTALGGTGLLADVGNAAVEANTFTGAEGRPASVGDIAMTYGTNKAFEYAGNLLNKVFSKGVKTAAEIDKPKLVKTIMDETGLDEQKSYFLSHLDDGQQQVTQDYIKAGLEKLDDPAAPGVYGKASQEVDDFLDAAKKVQTQVGSDLANAKGSLRGVAIDTAPIESKLEKLAEKYNIVGENWGDIDGASAAQKIYTKALDLATDPTVDARQVESLTSQIDRQIGVYSNKGVNVGNPAVRVLTDIKDGLNEAVGGTIEDGVRVGGASTEFGDLNQKYAQITSKIKQIEGAASDKIGNKMVANSETLLRRLDSNTGGKSQAALDAIDELASLTGVQAPSDLATKAHLAAIAEDITGSSKLNSFQGGIEGAMRSTRQVAGKELIQSLPGGKTLQAVLDELKGSDPVIQANAEKVVTYLSKGVAATPGASITDSLAPAAKSKIALAIQTIAKSGLLDQANKITNPTKSKK